MSESQIFLKDVLKVASNPQIYNETCYAINFEYKKFIGVCKKFTLKARGGGIKIAFHPNTSGVTYIYLSDGVSYNEDVILTPHDFMIYFQSTILNTVLEVIIWG